MKKVFLTGATGFLGGELLVMLSKRADIEKIFCLVRGNSIEEASIRLEHVFGLHDDFFDKNKIVPILGNMLDELLGDKLCANAELSNVDVIIHSAANTSFSKMYDNMVKKVNIDGTNQIIVWANSLAGLEAFVYVGTATICGKDINNRIVSEDESPNENSRQLVTYSYTKMIGEINVRKAIPKEKLLIVRPSIIMGDSRNIIPRSYVIMWALAAFSMMRLLPVNPLAGLDIASVDYVAKAIIELLFSKRNFTTYHISAGLDSATNLKMLIDSIRDTSVGPNFKFIDIKQINLLKLWAKKKLDPENCFYRENAEYFLHLESALNGNGNLRILLGALEAYFNFVNLGQVFDNSRLLTDTNMGAPEPAHSYMKRNKHHINNVDVLEGAIDP